MMDSCLCPTSLYASESEYSNNGMIRIEGANSDFTEFDASHVSIQIRTRNVAWYGT